MAVSEKPYFWTGTSRKVNNPKILKTQEAEVHLTRMISNLPEQEKPNLSYKLINRSFSRLDFLWGDRIIRSYEIASDVGNFFDSDVEFINIMRLSQKKITNYKNLRLYFKDRGSNFFVYIAGSKKNNVEYKRGDNLEEFLSSLDKLITKAFTMLYL